MMMRPEKNEYHRYYETYVSLVEETDVVAALIEQTHDLRNMLAGVTEERSLFRYAEDKWSVKELLGHLIDGERIFSYRALRISRDDKTPLEGFEQDGYIENSNFDATRFADLVEEFMLVRQSNILFFRNLTDEMWLRTGTASDSAISVRALAYIMVGHVRHHANILRERYSI
jgi:hypothetical protein